MPIFRLGDGTLMKMVGYHPSNPYRLGMPTILSTYSIFDADSGHLRAVVDGTLLTAMRTGAASALASQALARPDSRVVGLVGCGAQAVTQVHGLSRLFPIERVWGYDIDRQAAVSLAERLGWLDLEVEPIGREELERRLAETDILCTCTSEEPGEGPVLPNLPVPSHLHINAVGSDFPGKIELPVALLRQAVVVPDYLDQAQKEGECQQLSEHEIGPDLTSILRDRRSLDAYSERLTVFDSTGWALEDMVAFQDAFELAREMELGRLVDIECRGADPLNPYDIGPPLSSMEHLQASRQHGL
jgi:ornithine cyclodeaminase